MSQYYVEKKKADGREKKKKKKLSGIQSLPFATQHLYFIYSCLSE